MSPFQGAYKLVCLNPDGSVAWEESFPNGQTTAGLTHALATELGGGTQITTWFVGLISATGFTGLNVADTTSSHTGWQEVTSYNEATRPQWSPGAAAGGAITGPTANGFTLNASGTALGAFLCSSSTKGGSSGVLWAHGEFSQPRQYVPGQVLQGAYTCQLAGS
jgi:hypothetical protein